MDAESDGVLRTRRMSNAVTAWPAENAAPEPAVPEVEPPLPELVEPLLLVLPVLPVVPPVLLVVVPPELLEDGVEPDAGVR
jgi:hypothetical protein